MKLLSRTLIGMLTLLILFACSKTLTEEEYYEAAKEAYTKEKFEPAVANFKNIIQHYPQGKRAAEASFMLGFINANDIKNLDEAKKYYEAFIAKFPDHELADDAQYELQTLGKDINDLPIFKQLNADTLEQK